MKKLAICLNCKKHLTYKCPEYKDNKTPSDNDWCAAYSMIDNGWTQKIRELEAENATLKLTLREKDRLIDKAISLMRTEAEEISKMLSQTSDRAVVMDRLEKL